jgi:hypothetical protein
LYLKPDHLQVSRQEEEKKCSEGRSGSLTQEGSREYRDERRRKVKSEESGIEVKTKKWWPLGRRNALK